MASLPSFVTSCSWFTLVIVIVHSRPSVSSAKAKDDLSWWLDEAESEPTKSRRNTLDSISRGWRQHEPDALKRVFLKNSTVTCNDGSRAGYYIRKYPGSKVWLLFLEGGWYCFDSSSCESRWLTTNTLMSSKSWQEYHMASGILSGDPEENPLFWKSNIVFLPYCSSDVWTGTAPKVKGQKFSFMGSLILKEIIKALIPRGLLRARKILLAGSSAGGTGVLLNIDSVTEQLRQAGVKAMVKGLIDSGWFLENEPFSQADCVDPRRCSPVAGLKKGTRNWNSSLPSRCEVQFQSESWKCFFGKNVHATLQTSIFVAQYLYDEAQLMAGNVFVPRTKAQGVHVQRLRKDLSLSLQNVSAVFAPACVGHVMLTDKNWTKFSINGVTFGSALRCWWNGQHEERNAVPAMKTSESLMPSDEEGLMLGDDSSVANCAPARLKRCRRRLRRQQLGSRKHRKCRCSQAPKQRIRKVFDKTMEDLFRLKRHSHAADESRHTSRCFHHLVESCKLPNCNQQCPKNFDNFSGKPIDFEQMLRNAGVKSHSPIQEIFSR